MAEKNIEVVAKSGFGWKMYGLCFIALASTGLLIAGLMGVKLDTHLNSSDAKSIANSYNTYHGVQPTISDDVQNSPSSSTDIKSVAYRQPSQRQNIVFYEDAPEPEDLTVYIVKPEVRKRQNKVVIIDQRAQRLRREFLARAKEMETRPGGLPGTEEHGDEDELIVNAR